VTNRIDDHVSAAPPVLTTRAPTRVKLTEAEVAEREKQRTAAEARWLEIESKGGVDGWVRAKLIEAGHNPDAAAPANDDEKKTFKEKKTAERAERKKLRALANESRRFGTIGFLGNTIHWDELKGGDDFDRKDRAQKAEQNGLPP